MWNGGIEYGFMSFTTDRDVAHEPSSETIRGAEVPERDHDQVALIKATPRSFSPSYRLGRGLNYMN